MANCRPAFACVRACLRGFVGYLMGFATRQGKPGPDATARSIFQPAVSFIPRLGAALNSSVARTGI